MIEICSNHDSTRKDAWPHLAGLRQLEAMILAVFDFGRHELCSVFGRPALTHRYNKTTA
jgi:hypothetical protein